MILNKHSELADRHSFLSASKGSWSNYDIDKLDRVYMASLAARRGDELHALACEMIRLGVKPARTSKTFNMYVNDCIGYRMSPEQPLFVSDNCFGTADALAFRNNVLRISDLKTGATPSSMRQLQLYAAMFCLEYLFKPFEIGIELRIYQNDEVLIEEADPDLIFHLMDTIVTFDKRIDEMKKEALS